MEVGLTGGWFVEVGLTGVWFMEVGLTGGWFMEVGLTGLVLGGRRGGVHFAVTWASSSRSGSGHNSRVSLSVL